MATDLTPVEAITALKLVLASIPIKAKHQLVTDKALSALNELVVKDLDTI